MFSGLTNQFTSLVGAVKGGQADEDVPAPAGGDSTAATGHAADTSAAASAEHDPNAAGEQPVEGEEGAKRSPSLSDSLLTEVTGWLGSAKGWLGSASIPSMPAMPTVAMPSMPAMPAMPSIPSIPGLRKGGANAGDEAEGQADITGAVSGEDEDKSRYISATEGADSHPASGGGTPTGEEGQIGQVTTKVTQQAKHFGSFLSSAINKAGAKIKETVKDNTILDSFNKEQEAFIKGQGGNESGAAPWIGHNNEAKIKEEILGLSQDRRNFVRAPPAGVDFEFNYDTAYPTAIAIMAEDKALETMRFELVPKIITEENFWRNYFYRVSLIIQAAELGTLGADGVGQASSEDAIKAQYSETSSKTITTADTVAAAAASSSTCSSVANVNSNQNQKDTTVSAKNSKLAKSQQQQQQQQQQQTQKLSESEFVSDAFQSTNESSDLAEIKDGMRRLGIDSMTQQALIDETNEEQWEKDLEAELKDYEVVSDGGGGGGGVGGGGSKTGIGIGSSTSSSSGGVGKIKTDSVKTKKRGKGKKSDIAINDAKTTTTTTAAAVAAAAASSGSDKYNADDDDDDDGDEIPTISNLRTRSTNNDWEEYADLIEDTDDLK